MDEIINVILERLAESIYDKAVSLSGDSATEYDLSNNVDLLIDKLMTLLDKVSG